MTHFSVLSIRLVKLARCSSFKQITAVRTLSLSQSQQQQHRHHKPLDPPTLLSSRTLNRLSLLSSSFDREYSTCKNYGSSGSFVAMPFSKRPDDMVRLLARSNSGESDSVLSSSSSSYSTAATPSQDNDKGAKDVKGNDGGSSASNTAEGTATKTVSRKEKLKKAVKDYGATVIVFHVTMSLCSLGFFYLLVSSGLDVVSLLEKVGVGQAILESKITQGASAFVVAYAVHKVFAPVRITITLTSVPFIVKYLRRVGILKKPVN